METLFENLIFEASTTEISNFVTMAKFIHKEITHEQDRNIVSLEANRALPIHQAIKAPFFGNIDIDTIKIHRLNNALWFQWVNIDGDIAKLTKHLSANYPKSRIRHFGTLATLKKQNIFAREIVNGEVTLDLQYSVFNKSGRCTNQRSLLKDSKIVGPVLCINKSNFFTTDQMQEKTTNCSEVIFLPLVPLGWHQMNESFKNNDDQDHLPPYYFSTEIVISQNNFLNDLDLAKKFFQNAMNCESYFFRNMQPSLLSDDLGNIVVSTITKDSPIELIRSLSCAFPNSKITAKSKTAGNLKDFGLFGSEPESQGFYLFQNQECMFWREYGFAVKETNGIPTIGLLIKKDNAGDIPLILPIINRSTEFFIPIEIECGK